MQSFCLKAAGFLFISGCAATQFSLSKKRAPASEFIPVSADNSIDREIKTLDAKLDNDHLHTLSEVPIETNHKVQKWLKYFSKDRARFQRFLDRGEVYRPLIEKILVQEGIPAELYYLAMIESGFVVHATSHASAVGIWQFIPGTAQRFGLKKTSDVDERRDVIRATQAAAKYLKNLHAAFQSWYLAMAGYNAGEGRILRAVVNGGSRDFWELVQRKALPAETRNYVPKFLAALMIGRNPEKYGFNRPSESPFPDVESAQVKGRVSLAEIARHSRIELSTLKRLNPHLIQNRTPATNTLYPIWVPKGHAKITMASNSKLQQETAVKPRKVSNGSSIAKSQTRYHRVKRGESLSSISARYNVKIADLRKLNSLKSTKIHSNQKLIIAKNIPKQARRSYIKYRIRPGEGLAQIARRFSVSVSQLMKYNNLRSTRIYAGNRLKVPSNEI